MAKKYKSAQNGFALIEVSLMLFVICVVGGAAYLVLQRSKINEKTEYAVSESEGGDIAVLNKKDKTVFETCIEAGNERVILYGTMYCQGGNALYGQDGSELQVDELGGNSDEQTNSGKTGNLQSNKIADTIEYSVPSGWGERMCDSGDLLFFAPTDMALGSCYGDQAATMGVSGVYYEASNKVTNDCENLNQENTSCVTTSIYDYTYQKIITTYAEGTEGPGRLEAGGQTTKVTIYDSEGNFVISFFYTRRNDERDLTNDFNDFIARVKFN